jgi:hypothetical protein
MTDLQKIDMQIKLLEKATCILSMRKKALAYIENDNSYLRIAKTKLSNALYADPYLLSQIAKAEAKIHSRQQTLIRLQTSYTITIIKLEMLIQ